MHGLRTIKRMNNWRFDTVVGDENYPTNTADIMNAPTPRFSYTKTTEYKIYDQNVLVGRVSGDISERQVQQMVQQMEGDADGR